MVRIDLVGVGGVCTCLSHDVQIPRTNPMTMHFVDNPLHPVLVFEIMRRFIPQSLLKSLWPRKTINHHNLNHGDPVEEERTPYYSPTRFYPARIGEVLVGRYELVTKLGFGSHSTVWLARDLNRFEVKINATDRPEGKRLNKNEVLVSIANPTHPGWHFVQRLQETFEIQGPNFRHDCLVFQPLREPLWITKRRFPGNVIPLDLIRIMAHIMLKSLDYLHTECHIIHTDLKLDNIMTMLEDESLMDEMAQDEITNPLQQKIHPDRTIYLSRNDYGQPRSQSRKWCLPVLADLDHAVKGSGPHFDSVQAELYRAPEVILDAGWSYSVDIWSIGVLLWELAKPEPLFSELDPGYEEDYHLGYMAASLGEPPESLLSRGSRTSLFYARGQLISPPNIAAGLTLENKFGNEEDSDTEKFLALLRRMLTWLPEKRPSAKELLGDPWFSDIAESVEK